MKETVTIGVIGAGFLAETRVRCYAQLPGQKAIVGAVAASNAPNARAFGAKHGIAHAHGNYMELLQNPAIDIVDLCIPNHLHRSVTEMAAAYGKHIICTKPLTAYVGQDLPPTAIDQEISGRDPAIMREQAVEDASAMVEAADRAGVQLMYGENWIFAPSVQKARDLVCRSQGAILEMRGGECHNGSHSPYSKVWRYTGGGALLRLGAHPIGAMVYLKHQEGMARGGPVIQPVSVTAEIGDLSEIACQQGADCQDIAQGWQDVETWATAIVTFSDGSKGVAFASDNVLGGMQSWLEVFLSNSRIQCNLSPHNLVHLYAPNPEVFADTYLNEKASTSAGWNAALPDEDWSSGHVAMCHHFVTAVLRNEATHCDGRLGLEVTRIIYAAYQAAREGRRINL